MCRLAFLVLVVIANTAIGSSFSLWQDISPSTSSQSGRSSINLSLLPDSYRLLKLDEEEMRSILTARNRVRRDPNVNISTRLNAKQAKSIKSLEIPLPSGRSIVLKVRENHVMAAKLAARHPSIRTYQADNADNNGIYGAIDITQQGFHAMLFMPDGRRLFIDPRQTISLKKQKNINNNNKKKQTLYISYYNKDYHPSKKTPFQCHVKGHHHLSLSNLLRQYNWNNKTAKRDTSDSGDLTTYRLAMATTAEYTAFHGGILGASSAIVTTVNRVNVIYNQDLAIQLELIANNNLLIQTNSSVYSNNDGTAMLTENQALIDHTIGSDNYDIGHVASTGGGGVASIGTVCNSQYKARGVTGSSSPIGDAFDVDYVAHEIGHQFAAQHTFNQCSGFSRSTFMAYEPGSGSTIMAYAGICTLDNTQQHSDAMFHIKSISEIKAFLNRSNTNASCGTKSSLNNLPPIVSAGDNFTIPANTPFELTGSANDPENDHLSFSWEQIDKGDSSDIYTDTSNNPLFRVFPPQNTSSRTFPSINSILSGNSSIGETRPTTNRSLNFLLAVRDGKGNITSDQTTLSVISGHEFKIISHTSSETLPTGSVTEVTWDVANTNAAPINCNDVNILLSTNNGNSFVNISDGTTPNDGSELIIIPVETIPTVQARFKVQCDGNIFFNISSANLEIVTASNVDTDGDGTPDIDDAFPLDSSEDTDTDSDGIGNNRDTDDDGDGTLDINDAFPLDPSKHADSISNSEEPFSDTNSDEGSTTYTNPDVSRILPIIINLLLSD